MKFNLNDVVLVRGRIVGAQLAGEVVFYTVKFDKFNSPTDVIESQIIEVQADRSDV